MTDYETLVAYLRTKAIITPGKLYVPACRLFENNEDLARRIFGELTDGVFDQDSQAGLEFCRRCRKYVGSNSIVYKFINRLQQNFFNVEEELTDIFKKRPALRDIAYTRITEDQPKST